MGARLGSIGKAVALAVVVVLGVAGLWVAIGGRSYALSTVSRRLGRPVHVDGELSVRSALDGLTIRFTRLHVDQPAGTPGAPMVWIDRGAAVLPWTVLVGDSHVRSLELEGLHLRLRRDAAGRANWAGERTGAAPRPPRVDRLVLKDGTLDYQDLGRSLSFQGALGATLDPSEGSVLSVDGAGSSEGSPWSAQFRSTTVLTGSKPRAVTLHLGIEKSGGRSSADFQGQFTARDGGRLDGTLDASGPNLHDLSHLTNTPLPRTPPYRLHAQLARSGKGVQVQRLLGRIGASDVEGRLAITPDPAGRRVDGELRSRSLRISDLLAVMSGGQLTSGHRPADHILPDTPIKAAALRKLSGRIRFSAASVQAPTTPIIRSLQLNATFDHGRVGAEPMVLDLAHGRAVVRFMLDVRGATPRIGLSADLQHADTADFSRSKGARSPLRASFDSHVQLAGAGASLNQAAAHASGSLALRALNGRLQQVQAAVLSANLSRGLIALLGKSHDDVPLQCALARFQVSNGEARVTRLHLATPLGGVAGYGGFNLGSETIDLTLRPANPGGLDVSSVRIEGPLAHPRATLALDNPTHMARHVLDRLLHPASKPVAEAAGCG